MDNSIRVNKICVVGLPSCDFVFSSTRTCFIGYGFKKSTLEANIVASLLEDRGVEAVEAGGALEPGQYAFCKKICSKIITSQFCIVFVNNDVNGDGTEMPNANVSMEYGLMLGFNKYVIPFQLSEQNLPFNVAGLDTIKYTTQDLRAKATDAIDQAIAVTRQTAAPIASSDELLETYLLSIDLLFAPLDEAGERSLSRLGEPLGFRLLYDFAGVRAVYLGIFTALRSESVLWRIRILNEILNGRGSSIDQRMSSQESSLIVQAKSLFESIRILVIVTGEQDTMATIQGLPMLTLDYPVDVRSLDEIRSVLGEHPDYRC